MAVPARQIKVRCAVEFQTLPLDVMEELTKFTLLTHDVAPYLIDRYSERKESVKELAKRVNQPTIW